QKRRAHARVGQQEGAELLREDIVRADRVPHVAAGVVEAGRGRGDGAKPAVRDVFDLVVVVEHNSSVTRHAEVLEQQVTGEDVDGRELAQRVAVIVYDGSARAFVRAADEQVERSE